MESLVLNRQDNEKVKKLISDQRRVESVSTAVVQLHLVENEKWNCRITGVACLVKVSVLWPSVITNKIITFLKLHIING